MRRVLAGDAADLEMAALLGAMAARGETAAEIAGFATAMREAATALPLSELSGRSWSTPAGPAAMAAGRSIFLRRRRWWRRRPGAKVAKHGNKAVTSQSGSADVLEALGIPTTLELRRLRARRIAANMGSAFCWRRRIIKALSGRAARAAGAGRTHYACMRWDLC